MLGKAGQKQPHRTPLGAGERLGEIGTEKVGPTGPVVQHGATRAHDLLCRQFVALVGCWLDQVRKVIGGMTRRGDGGGGACPATSVSPSSRALSSPANDTDSPAGMT